MAVALGGGVFVVAMFCLAVPRTDNGHLVFWYTTGLPLAALLRTQERQWPALLAASATGIVLASLLHGNGAIEAAIRTVSSCLQCGLSAWILRRRLGSYFDLRRRRHVHSLICVVACVAAALLVARTPLALLLENRSTINLGSGLLWYVMTTLSVLVLGLPALSLTARSETTTFRRDLRSSLRSLGTLMLLLALQTLILVLSFGPAALPGVFVVMPVLMLIAWTHGLQGAGVANLLGTVVVGWLTYERLGAVSVLDRAGQASLDSGVYLVVFFSVCQIASLPLAIARARQTRLTEDLAAALAAAERREQAAKLAEAEAVQAREQLRGVIETSTDIICTLDPNGRFLDISENCLDLWGRSRASLLGRYFLGTVAEDERNRLHEAWKLRTNPQMRQTIRVNHPLPDGTNMPMTWSATWIAEKQVTHCVGRDMSDYNAMEARVHQAQRMDAIGQLTGGVAHDFNNLLTVVLGSCEEVAMGLEDPRQRQMLEMALRAGEKCAELTRQLLAFARRQTLAPQAFDLNDRIAAAAPLIVRTLGSDLEFSIRTSGDLAQAYADPLQTETAILNLCLNARDAMPAGGQLLIETANARLTETDVERYPDARVGDYVMVTVSDTGTGIAPQIIERIFDPFFTTKDIGSGTGLGLSMVHGFVNQSNGHIEVTSTPGKGTRFRLYLPVAEPGAAATVRPEPKAAALRYGEEHVLLVEDHPLVRTHLQKKLESLGYRVAIAGNGADALAMLERHDDIDLLLTDVVMPGGMGGLQLGRIVAERWPGVRILYTTGYAPDMVTGGGRLLDGAAILPKPYSKTELAVKVRSVLDGAIPVTA